MGRPSEKKHPACIAMYCTHCNIFTSVARCCTCDEGEHCKNYVYCTGLHLCSNKTFLTTFYCSLIHTSTAVHCATICLLLFNTHNMIQSMTLLYICSFWSGPNWFLSDEKCYQIWLRWGCRRSWLQFLELQCIYCRSQVPQPTCYWTFKSVGEYDWCAPPWPHLSRLL